MNWQAINRLEGGIHAHGRAYNIIMHLEVSMVSHNTKISGKCKVLTSYRQEEEEKSNS